MLTASSSSCLALHSSHRLQLNAQQDEKEASTYPGRRSGGSQSLVSAARGNISWSTLIHSHTLAPPPHTPEQRLGGSKSQELSQVAAIMSPDPHLSTPHPHPPEQRLGGSKSQVAAVSVGVGSEAREIRLQIHEPVQGLTSRVGGGGREG